MGFQGAYNIRRTLKETSVELQGVFKRVLKGDLEGGFRWDFKPDLEGDLLSSSGPQFRSGLASGLGQVQLGFSSKLKFNKFHVHQCQAQIETSSGVHLTFT